LTFSAGISTNTGGGSFWAHPEKKRVNKKKNNILTRAFCMIFLSHEAILF
jgi:hypothetical protein